MSSYDSSTLIKRKQNKTIANSFISRLNSNTTSYGPLTGIYDNSILNNVKQGQMKFINKCYGGGFEVDTGCPCQMVDNESVSNGIPIPPTPPPSDIEGTVQWAVYLANADLIPNGSEGNSTTVDSLGNVYITGYYRSDVQITLKNVNGNTQSDSSYTLPATNSGGRSVFIIKYNSSGLVQWVTYLDGDSIGEVGYSVSFDSSNNIYITGRYDSTTSVPLYNASGFGQSLSGISLQAQDSAVFLIKYDTSGQAQWAIFLNGANTDSGQSISFDSSNNVYVTGFYNSNAFVTLQNATPTGQTPSSILLPSSSSINAMFIMKYNSAGVVQRATYMITSGGSRFSEAFSIITDTAGNSYVTGTYRSSPGAILYNATPTGQILSSYTLGTVSTSAVFLIKYNTNCEVQWATYFNGTVNLEQGKSILLDSLNNIYISGYYGSGSLVDLQDASGFGQVISPVKLPSSSNIQTSFLVKYNSLGQAQWATYLNSSGSNAGFSISIDSTDNIYATGTYSGSVVLKDVAGDNLWTNSLVTLPTVSNTMYVIKYNTSGLVQWATYLNSSGTGYSVKATSNSLYITGFYNSGSIITLPSAVGTGQVLSSITLPSSNSTNQMFLIKYV